MVVSTIRAQTRPVAKIQAKKTASAKPTSRPQRSVKLALPVSIATVGTVRALDGISHNSFFACASRADLGFAHLLGRVA